MLVGAGPASECLYVMLLRALAIFRAAGGVRLALLWYATIVIVVPILYILIRWRDPEALRFVPWIRMIAAAVLMPWFLFGLGLIGQIVKLKRGRRQRPRNAA
jgi:hypothetical protein